MTPEQNTDIVKRAYASFKSGDMNALMATYANDVSWEVYGPSTIPTAGVRKGLSGVQEFFGMLDSAMSVQSFEPREFIAQGDQVVVLGDYSWKVKATGRTFTAKWAHVATLKDGKIVRFREYTDTAAAVAAFGG
jgi:ketosteroid isomerase-like protein